MERSIREGSPELAAESFEAGQANRAVSLRNRLKAGMEWQTRLPANYGQKLSELRRAELALRPDEATSDVVAGLRAEVTEMESQAGLQEQPLETDPLHACARFNRDWPRVNSWRPLSWKSAAVWCGSSTAPPSASNGFPQALRSSAWRTNFEEIWKGAERRFYRALFTGPSPVGV